jgi:hypothetical protein
MDENADRPSNEPETPTARPGATAQRYGSLQRLWMVFTSPGEVFADIKVKPAWVLCLVAMVVLGVAVQIVVAPHIDTEATLRARLGDRVDDLSDQQIEDLVERGQKFAQYAPIIGVVVGPLAWGVMAAVFFLMLKVVGSDADYPQVFSSTLHAYWPPSVVQAALTATLIQRFDALPQQELNTVVKSHLGALLSPDAPAWLVSAASTISIFNVWTVVLLVIGFAIVGGVPRGKAVVAACVPWGVWLAAKAGLGAVLG